MSSLAGALSAIGLKRSVSIAKPGAQRIPGGLAQATKVGFVDQAKRFSAMARPHETQPIP
jgi:hypothetical protein